MGAKQELTHDDEQWKSEQFLRGQDVPGVLGQELVERNVAEERQHERAGDRERDPDPHAAGEQAEQDPEQRSDDAQHFASRSKGIMPTASAPPPWPREITPPAPRPSC